MTENDIRASGKLVYVPFLEYWDLFGEYIKPAEKIHQKGAPWKKITDIFKNSLGGCFCKQ